MAENNSYSFGQVQDKTQAQGNVSTSVPQLNIDAAGARLTAIAEGGQFEQQAANDQAGIDGLVKVAGKIYQPQLEELKAKQMLIGYQKAAAGQSIQSIRDEQPWYFKIFGDTDVVTAARSYTSSKNVSDVTSDIMNHMDEYGKLTPDQFQGVLNGKLEASRTGDTITDLATAQSAVQMMPQLIAMQVKANTLHTQREANITQFNAMNSAGKVYNDVANNPNATEQDRAIAFNNYTSAMQKPEGQSEDSYEQNFVDHVKFSNESGNYKAANTLLATGVGQTLSPANQILLAASKKSAESQAKVDYSNTHLQDMIVAQSVLKNPNATFDEKLQAVNNLNSGLSAFTGDKDSKFINESALTGDEGERIVKEQQISSQDAFYQLHAQDIANLKILLSSGKVENTPESFSRFSAAVDVLNAENTRLTGDPSPLIDKSAAWSSGVISNFNTTAAENKASEAEFKKDETLRQTEAQKQLVQKNKDDATRSAVHTGNLSQTVSDYKQDKDKAENIFDQEVAKELTKNTPESIDKLVFMLKSSGLSPDSKGQVIVAKGFATANQGRWDAATHNQNFLDVTDKDGNVTQKGSFATVMSIGGMIDKIESGDDGRGFVVAQTYYGEDAVNTWHQFKQLQASGMSPQEAWNQANAHNTAGGFQGTDRPLTAAQNQAMFSIIKDNSNKVLGRGVTGNVFKSQDVARVDGLSDRTSNDMVKILGPSLLTNSQSINADKDTILQSTALGAIQKGTISWFGGVFAVQPAGSVTVGKMLDNKYGINISDDPSSDDQSRAYNVTKNIILGNSQFKDGFQTEGASSVMGNGDSTAYRIPYSVLDNNGNRTQTRYAIVPVSQIADGYRTSVIGDEEKRKTKDVGKTAQDLLIKIGK